MAVNVNVSRGVGTLTNPRFYKMAVLVFGGMAFGTVATRWLNDNSPNLNIPGEEAIYALVAVLVVRTAMSGKTSMLVSAGIGAGATSTVLRELGVM